LTIDKLEIFKSAESDNANSIKYFLAFTFQGLSNREGGEEPLNDIVKRLNKCLGSFKLPAYYKNPIHHLSLCSFSIKNTEQVEFCKEKLLVEANVSLWGVYAFI